MAAGSNWYGLGVLLNLHALIYGTCRTEQRSHDVVYTSIITVLLPFQCHSQLWLILHREYRYWRDTLEPSCSLSNIRITESSWQFFHINSQSMHVYQDSELVPSFVVRGSICYKKPGFIVNLLATSVLLLAQCVKMATVLYPDMLQEVPMGHPLKPVWCGPNWVQITANLFPADNSWFVSRTSSHKVLGDLSQIGQRMISIRDSCGPWCVHSQH